MRSTTHEVTISKYDNIAELFPNVFTPNNDDLNETWQLVNSLHPSQFESLKVEVYNRWGQLVFSTNDAAFSWDGTFEGKDLGDAVYFWLAWYTDICGNESAEKGVVHIMR